LLHVETGRDAQSIHDKYNVSPVPAGLLWDAKDADDYLHNPSPQDALTDRRSCTVWTARGWLNMGTLIILTTALVVLFAGYPIISHYTTTPVNYIGAYGPGGINATGQVASLPGMPNLLDVRTPSNASTWTSFEGQQYNLVFSDEFDIDGRTFWPGDDPYWEAVDLHYWATNDYEWYDPDAVTTKDGALEITITEQPWRGLNFRWGGSPRTINRNSG
jgi:beta-glucan synthesis-associated protein KRE6